MKGWACRARDRPWKLHPEFQRLTCFDLFFTEGQKKKNIPISQGCNLLVLGSFESLLLLGAVLFTA